MTTQTLEFPALYESADQGSASAQSAFWWTIRWEYFLLFCVAVASATRHLPGLNPLVMTLLLVILAGLFVFKVYRKRDQEWYHCRALAESVKTSTWRFAMRAHPFQDAETVEVPKAEFRNLLRDILKTNRHLAESLFNVEADQITSSMLTVRQLSLRERIDFYVAQRIDDQRVWYTRKSAVNRQAFRVWIVSTIAIYVLARPLALHATSIGAAIRIDIGWAGYAFDPLIVVVTSAIGWMQMKRHSELMASYNLTAQEIGIIRGNSDQISTENEFSDFVNEAERAFIAGTHAVGRTAELQLERFRISLASACTLRRAPFGDSAGSSGRVRSCDVAG